MDNKLPQRKCIRLKNYDYSQNGYYFITICTKDKKKILSTINENANDVGVGVPDDPQCNNSQIELTYTGKIIEKHINSINKTYKEIQIHDYIIMPNHIHMVCVIQNCENGSSRTPTPTNAKIPFLISTFKRLTNKECNRSIWQRSYYEHVIRNENDYLRILEYIQMNPLNWIYDKYY